MAQFPSMPLWTDAYLGDTQHLTLEEHGAYLKLLIIAWRSPGCSLPDDDKRLATMLGITPKKWASLKPAVMGFWSAREGKWTQKRLTFERKKVSVFAEQKRTAAEASLSARGLKRKGTTPTDVAPPLPTAGGTEYPTGSQPSISISNKVKKEKIPQAVSSLSVPQAETAVAVKDEINEAVKMWNEVARQLGIPTVQKLTGPRKQHLRRRLGDGGGLAGWRAMLDKISKIPGLLGAGNGGWRANFDFVVSDRGFTRIMEGNYDHWTGGGNEAAMAARQKAEMDAAAAKVFGEDDLTTIDGSTADDDPGRISGGQGTGKEVDIRPAERQG